jgi:hypothetical protein
VGRRSVLGLPAAAGHRCRAPVRQALRGKAMATVNSSPVALAWSLAAGSREKTIQPVGAPRSGPSSTFNASWRTRRTATVRRSCFAIAALLMAWPIGRDRSANAGRRLAPRKMSSSHGHNVLSARAARQRDDRRSVLP